MCKSFYLQNCHTLHFYIYNCLDDLFYDDEGKWKHSKVNKTALSSLCKIEAFGSLQEFREDKIKNHRQLLAMMTDNDNYNVLKKGRYGLTKTQVKRALKNEENLTPIIKKLLDEYSELPDWNRQEKILNYVEAQQNVS